MQGVQFTNQLELNEHVRCKYQGLRLTSQAGTTAALAVSAAPFAFVAVVSNTPRHSCEDVYMTTRLQLRQVTRCYQVIAKLFEAGASSQDSQRSCDKGQSSDTKNPRCNSLELLECTSQGWCRRHVSICQAMQCSQHVGVSKPKL